MENVFLSKSEELQQVFSLLNKPPPRKVVQYHTQMNAIFAFCWEPFCILPHNK